MALNDLTDQNIQDTYQKVVQTDGTNIADGTGSALPIKFDGPDLIVSGALRAQSYIVSQSIINVSSGSTIFGDTPDDQHIFTGSLKVTGSGIFKKDVRVGIHDGFNSTGHGSRLTIERYGSAYPEAHIYCGGSDNNTQVGFAIVTRNNSGISEGAFEIRGSDRRALFSGTENVEIASGNISASGYILGQHITASGNISSSGGGNNYFGGNMLIDGAISSSEAINAPELSSAAGVLISATEDLRLQADGNGDSTGIIQFGNRTEVFANMSSSVFSFAGNITASGTISASGHISATGHITSSGTISASGDISATGKITTDGILYTDDIQRLTDNSTSTRISMGGNNIQLYAGSATNEIAQFKSNDGTTFNQDGIPEFDFRVEGDTDTHLIFADAGEDKVAIGTDTVSDSLLTVDGDIKVTNLTASNASFLSASFAGNITSSGTISASGMIQTAGAISSSTGITASAAFFSGDITSSGNMSITNATSYKPEVRLESTANTTNSGVISFVKQRFTDSTQAAINGDILGGLNFYGNSSIPLTGEHLYAQIYSDIDEVTFGQGSGRLTFRVANDDMGLGTGLTLTGGSENNEIDVTVGLGANSVVTIPGNIDLAGDIDVDGTMEADAITLGGATVLAAIDEDNMTSNSATAVPTQQSVKAYADTMLPLAGGTMTGAINFDSENMTNVDIDSGTIDNTDVTVGSGKTLDVSAGTLTLANNQISGDKVEGGTIASITISQLGGALDCNNENMTNVDIDSGTIDNTDVTVGSGKTLDVSAGTLTTSAAQNQAIVSAADGAAIDNCIIGANTAAAATFTSITSTTSVGIPFVIGKESGYLGSFSDGEYYYGNNSYGWNHHQFTNKISSNPDGETWNTQIGSARQHNAQIVPVACKNITLLGEADVATNNNTVEILIYKTTRQAGNSTVPTTTQIGNTSTTLANAARYYNIDITTTETVAAGDKILVIVRPGGTSGQVRWNYTLFGYTNG